MIDVTVCGGKYRYIFDHAGARAFRYGEKLRDCTGDKFIMALAQDLEEAREERDGLVARINAAESLAVEWQQRHAELYVAAEEYRNRAKYAEQRLGAIQDLLAKAAKITGEK